MAYLSLFSPHQSLGAFLFPQPPCPQDDPVPGVVHKEMLALAILSRTQRY